MRDCLVLNSVPFLVTLTIRIFINEQNEKATGKCGNILVIYCKMGYKLSNIKKIVPIEPSCKKPIYNSAEEAQDMIRHIKESRDVREIHPYKCTICGFWHLTSKSK
jgi:hypothetical protein